MLGLRFENCFEVYISPRIVRYETGLNIFPFCIHTSETCCRQRDSYRLYGVACRGNSEIARDFIRYDLLIDGQSSEWNAIRCALLLAPPVLTLAFISASTLVLLPALERWISL
jgi:hypothetical protein